jgi:GGDEF domain-containing protein
VLDGETVHSELEYACPSPAASRWFLLRLVPLSGGTGGAVVSHVNITRRKMAEQALVHEAAHDPLTGLANRSLFADQLAAALAPRPDQVTGSQVGLLFLDVDGFKEINDTYGHDAGDEVLLTVAHRLRSNVRPQDTVARLGGDEFAVAAPPDHPGRAGRVRRPDRGRAGRAAPRARAPAAGDGEHRHRPGHPGRPGQ